MARQLQECDHCKGKKQCTRSGGRSCDICRRAAGRGPRDWATVRCSFCGGLGKVWITVEDEPAPDAPAPDDAPPSGE